MVWHGWPMARRMACYQCHSILSHRHVACQWASKGRCHHPGVLLRCCCGGVGWGTIVTVHVVRVWNNYLPSDQSSSIGKEGRILKVKVPRDDEILFVQFIVHCHCTSKLLVVKTKTLTTGTPQLELAPSPSCEEDNKQANQFKDLLQYRVSLCYYS
jgi:hypothetical protein